MNLITIGEACEVANLSRETLRRWTLAGKLKSFKKAGSGHKTFVDRDELERLMKPVAKGETKTKKK